MVFQFTSWHLTLGGIERSNQGHLVFFGLCIMLNVLLDSGAVRPRGLLLSWRHDFLKSWQTFWHHDVFLTSWQTFGVFLTSWQNFWRHDTLLDIMTSFLCHDEPFEVMTNILSHGGFFFTSWTFWRQGELFDVVTYFWPHDVFLMSWPAFYRHDICSSFREQNNMKTCFWCHWHHGIFFTSWQSFDVMTNLLTSWLVFFVMTNFLK